MKKDCIAMILAGGQGSRLGALTKDVAKPAVQYGGKYRIIDFALTNCVHSGIDTVGVLTQYKPLELNTYISTGSSWDLDRMYGGVFVLPPYMTETAGEWYKGTANAIYQNIEFIKQFNPENVLILSGDHIYKMNYNLMLKEHIKKNADITIGLITVPMEEASRFGILSTDKDNRVTDFEEKPKEPKSNLASMGIYIFKWDVLEKELIRDERDENSSKDFGKDIIPHMLKEGKRVFGYNFNGYWKDVGTVYSLWEANMDLLDSPDLDIANENWKIYSKPTLRPPQKIGKQGSVKNSLITEGCVIDGEIDHSVIFDGVYVFPGAVIKNSVIMSECTIRENAVIENAIIGKGCFIDENVVIGQGEPGEFETKYCANGVTLVAPGITISKGKTVGKNAMLTKDI